MKQHRDLAQKGFSQKVAAAALTLSLVVGLGGLAGARGLPKTFAWTAFGTTSSSYAISVAIGDALSTEGYKLWVVPARNDITRMTFSHCVFE